MKTKNLKSKFTLIEIIIVIGIVCFLISMAMPGLLRAREMAKKVYCMNNLNQTVKVTSMYNLDYGAAPYSSTWLIDFSFLSKYISQDKYGIMECPDTDDKVIGEGALNGGTSYHYMGSRDDWEKNNISKGDGAIYGFDATNPEIATKLSMREEKIIYDKSDTVHYGNFNFVYVESGHTGSSSWHQRGKYWFVTSPSTLNYDDSDYPDRSHNLNEALYGYKFVDQGVPSDTESDDELGDDTGNGDNPGGGSGSGDNPGGGSGSGDKKPWKVRIIHYPPGNPRNQQEICVGYAAWPAHQAHGDELLEIIYK